MGISPVIWYPEQHVQHPSRSFIAIAYGGLSETNLHKQAKSSITMQRRSIYYDGSSKAHRAERENNLEGTSTLPTNKDTSTRRTLDRTAADGGGPRDLRDSDGLRWRGGRGGR